MTDVSPGPSGMGRSPGSINLNRYEVQPSWLRLQTRGLPRAL